MTIRNNKVVRPPIPKLTKKQRKQMENAPINHKMIKEALAIEFNLVY